MAAINIFVIFCWVIVFSFFWLRLGIAAVRFYWRRSYGYSPSLETFLKLAPMGAVLWVIGFFVHQVWRRKPFPHPLPRQVEIDFDEAISNLKLKPQIIEWVMLQKQQAATNYQQSDRVH